jgi:hypothetical protein
VLAELKDLWARVRVRWHAVAAALIVAAPSLLLYLEGVDLRPILAHFMPENYVELIVAILPFVIAFMKPMIHLAEPEDD